MKFIINCIKKINDLFMAGNTIKYIKILKIIINDIYKNLLYLFNSVFFISIISLNFSFAIASA